MGSFLIDHAYGGMSIKSSESFNLALEPAQPNMFPPVSPSDCSKKKVSPSDWFPCHYLELEFLHCIAIFSSILCPQSISARTILLTMVVLSLLDSRLYSQYIHSQTATLHSFCPVYCYCWWNFKLQFHHQLQCLATTNNFRNYGGIVRQHIWVINWKLTKIVVLSS